MKKHYIFEHIRRVVYTILLMSGMMLWGAVSLNAQSLPITGTDAVRCGAGELTLTVGWSGQALDASKVKWYTVPFYGTPIATGLTHSTGYIEFTQTFYVDYIGDNGCSQCDRLLVRAVINDNAIDPQISYSSLKFCNNLNQNFAPTIVGASGGTFTVSPSTGLTVNGSTGIFNPSGASPGQYTITFTPVQVVGCNSGAVSTSVNITQALVVPQISYAQSSYCSSAGLVSVTKTGLDGGTYSAYPSGLTINASTGELTPSSSSTGTYTVSYTVPGNGGCAPVVGTTTVSILKLPTATIAYTAESYTKNQGAQAVTLTGTDDYLGGTFSAGAGLSIDASTGTITPASSTAGTYTVTYTKAAVSPCADALIASATVTIYGATSASIAADVIAMCQNGTEPVVTFTGGGGTAPYTINYTINNGGSLDATIVAGNSTTTVNHPTLVSGIFTYRITGVTDINGSTTSYNAGSEPSVVITITSPQVASFEYSGSPYCSNDSNPTPNFLGGGVAGTFSSTAGLVFVDTATGEIDISASTPGTYTVTNTIVAAGGCSVVTATASVTITPLPIATFSYANASYCQLDTDPTVTLGTGAEHGIYTSDPIGIVFLANGGINLDESAPNSYTIYNTVMAADGCVQVQESTTITITPEIIISTPVFNAGATTARCQAAETLNIYGALSTGSGNITYSYALDAASITGGNTIDATTGAVTWVSGWSGTTEITVTASAPCAQNKTAIHTVTVNQSGALDTPTFTAGNSSTRCQAEDNVAYTLSNYNANFTYNYTLDNTSVAGGNVSFSFQNDVTWSANWYGVSTLTVKASSGCSSSPEATITITTNPVPAIPTGTDVTVTYDGQTHTGLASSTVPVIGGSDVAANIVWYDASTGGNVVTAPAGTNVGTYTAWAEAVAPSTGCISTERTLVTVTINQRPLTANTTISDKIYDGSAATGTVNLGIVSNLVSGESLNITPTAANFANANVADGKATTISYALANGAGGLAANYSMADIAATGDINPLLLAINDPTLTLTKVYDGNTTATVTANALTNNVGSDDVTINTAIANYDTKDVGTGKTITVGYTISGADATNYITPVDYIVTTGEITTAPLSITSPTIASKVYDGTATAGAVTTGTLSGFVGTETVTTTAVAANYSSANVGTYNGVVVTYTLVDGTNGGLATNYSLATGTATGVITAAPLSIASPTIASKVYDGTATSGAVTPGTLSGFIGTETVTTIAVAADYSSANVGTYNGVVVTYTLANGTNGGLATNYSLANGSADGEITAKALTITANAAIKGYGVELTSPTTGSTAFRVGTGELLNSDAVSSVTLTYLNDVETGTKAVGSYASSIEPSAAQGTGLSNYGITYTKGSMTIYEVIVEATAGTTLAGYNTMKAAYDAINAGTHQGVIVVKVYANTTEIATATLNDSGVGSASYDSVTIQAMAGVTISGSASPVMNLGQEAVNP